MVEKRFALRDDSGEEEGKRWGVGKREKEGVGGRKGVEASEEGGGVWPTLALREIYFSGVLEKRS